MAQVARAQTEARRRRPRRPEAADVRVPRDGGPRQEIAVTTKIKSVADGIATVSTQAKQGSTRVVRNGVAEIVVPPIGG